MSTYEGRLELTWTNKNLRLLSGVDGSYTWVPRSDYRVSEVRLLHDAETVGETHPLKERAKDNLLIHGDALDALRSLVELPEFAREYVGRVKLAYLDPPFNTQQSFLHYDDALEHSVWLTMMRDRLLQVKQLLSADGSVWVHCDDSEQAYLRVMMDEYFGRENFIACVLWEKFATRDNRTLISISHDYLVVYAQERNLWRRNLTPFGSDQTNRYKNTDNDPRGPWTSLPIHAQGGHGTPSQFYTITLPSGRKIDPPPGNCWRFTEPRLRELIRDNRIWFGPNGNNAPRLKRFLSDVEQGLVPKTLWLSDEVGTTGTAKAEVLTLNPNLEPFATPKPEALLKRIIEIGSDPGEIVLDCFLGSGTTAAVAHKMGRHWVGVEREGSTVEKYALPRIVKVVEGQDQGGVTGSTRWEGGGGFRLIKVAPSMFEDDGGGAIVLAEWATNGALSQATAAQLGFDFQPEPPLVGRKGRQRLAVVDGLVNAGVVSLLVQSLSEDQRLVVCGTAVDPEARTLLRQLRPGSIVRKIPSSLLDEYRARTNETYEVEDPEALKRPLVRVAETAPAFNV